MDGVVPVLVLQVRARTRDRGEANKTLTQLGLPRSTTYVAEELYASLPKGAPIPSSDDATRSGSFALLLYSLVSLVAGTVIPFLTHLATTYPSLPSRVGPAGRWLLARMTPRNAWTVGLAWYAACMVLTFFLNGLKGATAVVAISGVPWAITCWVSTRARQGGILKESADARA